ncbi:MAG TPA: tRNA epoxyqueuosine(34) reductase QueG, partial [Gammaproteobacteria bacterium]|nr:tRNA epoxyqueuosine(34) reductase QueG [Gammaproteobacteria bacterium]
KPLADKAGLGWTGKHSNIISREAGSWFFLGEIYTSLALPKDTAVSEHCGRCTACIDICPTQAIVAPYQVDARRCISYLTIENHGEIPVGLRPLIGNRIYGCDDCQLICPWNRFARTADLPDFAVRNGLDSPTLLALFNWSEAAFLKRLEGSPIRRIGYRNWLRNIAVAMGNGAPDPATLAALAQRANDPDPLLHEHINWALETLRKKEANQCMA